jgi:putative ABC transport system substrate-binding protein
VADRGARAGSGRPIGARWRIGVLTLGVEANNPCRAAFVDGLRERGYIETKNVDIDYRYADGDVGRLVPLAQQLMALKPDVLVGGEPSPTRALKAVAPSLPIVCPLLAEAVFREFAASYARPGGTVTGIAFNVEGMSGKLVELALERVPGALQIGFLSNHTGPNMPFFRRDIEDAATTRHISMLVEDVTTADGLAPALHRLIDSKVHALIVPLNSLLQNEAPSIVQLATSARLPTIFAERRSVELGGLASYGIDEKENFRRAADYVDRILKGAKPAEMPIEFPTKIELVINLKTAKTLALEVPLHIQQRADDVIE